MLQSIAITPATLPPIPLGATITFAANGSSGDGSASPLAGAAWTSSNPGVVSVTAGGVATGAGTGSAVLTATSGLVSGTLAVDVRPASLVSIGVTPTTFNLAAGEATPTADQLPIGPSQQLAATGIYNDGSNRDLTGVA